MLKQAKFKVELEVVVEIDVPEGVARARSCVWDRRAS